MMKHDVRTPEQAVAYLVDCTLATVASMAFKKSRPKAEYRRQILIAQTGIDWMRHMQIDGDATRCAKILLQKITVEQWAKQYEV